MFSRMVGQQKGRKMNLILSRGWRVSSTHQGLEGVNLQVRNLVNLRQILVNLREMECFLGTIGVRVPTTVMLWTISKEIALVRVNLIWQTAKTKAVARKLKRKNSEASWASLTLVSRT